MTRAHYCVGYMDEDYGLQVYTYGGEEFWYVELESMQDLLLWAKHNSDDNWEIWELVPRKAGVAKLVDASDLKSAG